jgi:predicted nucleotidyltransferase
MIDFKQYKDEIANICKRHDVKKLVLFGSAISDEFKSNSDLDFIIEFSNPDRGIKKYMNVKFELEELLKRQVDLVMPKAINNKNIKKYIYSNTRKLYEA